MDSTFLSLLCFSITTLLYYIFKPKPSHLMTNDNSDIEGIKSYNSKKLLFLVVYLLLTLVTQFAVNASVIAANCGGSITKNIGVGAFITFIPWIIVFGAMTMVLMIFPGFKYAFSNVVGYFAVAGQANSILTKLLANTELEKILEKEKGNISEEEKNSLQRAAESIVKLAGNKSILINQIVPENFSEYWMVLEPLMKREYFSSKSDELGKLKESLFGLTILRDNIGEAFWYLYTGILLIFIVKYYIATKGCAKDAFAMTASAAEYQDQTQQQQQEQDKLNSQVYVG